MNILIATHGDLARELLQTTRMIVGDAPNNSVFTVALHQSVEVFEEEVRKVHRKTKSASILLLTDMFGATPFNVCLRVFGDVEHRIVTGVNVPMLAEVLMQEDAELSLYSSIALDEGKNGIKEFYL